MDGWMDVWTDEWMNGRMDGWMSQTPYHQLRLTSKGMSVMVLHVKMRVS